MYIFFVFFFRWLMEGVSVRGMEIIQLMLDNFLEQEYHSYDKVYVHPESKAGIFIGDFQAAADGQFHKKCNIKTIVTAAVNMDHLVFGQSIAHVIYPLLDSKTENIATFFQKFYEVIEKHARMGNILVHCSAGISRSSTLVISYIMRKEKRTFKEAIAIVRKARPKVLPNLGFERQLKSYEQVVRKRSTRSERIPRRAQIRTSESGKSQRSIRIGLFQFDNGFPSLQIERSRDSQKMKRCIEQLTEKGIQMPKPQSGRREQNKNRIALADRLKKINPIKNERTIKTQLCEAANLFQFLRVQNKRIFKSKTIINDQPYAPLYNSKHMEPFKKHFSEYRKCSLLNNMRPFQKE